MSVCQHPHLAHADAKMEIERLTIKESCKRKAQEDDRPLRQIFDEVCRQSTSSAVHQVSFVSMESSMYKRRRVAQPALPSGPDTADDAVLSSRHAQLNGHPFYRGLADAEDSSSALIFATDEQLIALKDADHVYFDATFKVVPAIYYQLFTVFVPCADNAFPVFFALMTRKNQAAYRAVFNKLHELVPDFQPVTAMADYEEASVSALREVFQDVHVSGCWFHFAQSIVKRVNKTGLKDAYTNDASVKDTVQCLFGLPLLPVEQIVLGLQDIKSAIHSDGPFARQMQHLVAYVKRQWLDRRSVGAERLCVRDNPSRTNNVLESYHSGNFFCFELLIYSGTVLHTIHTQRS